MFRYAISRHLCLSLLAASLTVLGLLLIFLAPASAYATQAGPVAAFSFDEGEGTTAQDLTGDGHTATLEGAEWTTHGRYGGAMEFDASEGDELTIPASEDFHLEEFTLEAWVRPDEARELAPVVADTTTGPAAGPGWALFAGGYLGEPGHPEGLTTEGDSIASSASREGPLPDDAWTHLAATYDGAKLRLYVDGELVDTTATTPGLVLGEGELQIGGDEPWDEGGFFDGRIDELRIYDRALDGAEVAADMEAPIQTPKQGPVAAWSFDEGEGTTAEDLTGHGHTATLEGATWANGRYGHSLHFDGEAGCVSVAESEDLRLDEEFTLEAWVRPDPGSPGDEPIVTQEDEGAAEGEEPYAYSLLAGNGETPEGWVRIEAEHEYAGIYGDEALPAGAWSHIALTDDGAHLRLYQDGRLVRTVAAPVLTEAHGELTIGCIKAFGAHFTGRVDELRVYNRALGAEEVAADMEAPIQTPKAGPVAAWSFDEGTGETVQDLTGDGHTATIEGATWARGRYGDGLEFDGSADCVSIADAADLRLGEEFTVESWARPEGELDDDPVVAKEGSGYTNYALMIGDATAGRPEGSIGVAASPHHIEVTDPESTAAATWIHLASVFDGSEEHLYVNGALVATESVEGAESGREGGLKIGCDIQRSEHFTGRIDEIRIYNRTLNATELRTDASRSLDTEPPNIELTGPLTEGLNEEESEYPISIEASDDRGVGVRSAAIFVDGNEVERKGQRCVKSGCDLHLDWVYNSNSYPGVSHELEVQATDQVGNVASRTLQLASADGSFPACSPMGSSPEAEPKEVLPLSGGGEIDVYENADGSLSEFPVSPENFDPLEASNAELAAYGFPPRPSDPEKYSEWKQIMAHAGATVQPGGCAGVASENSQPSVEQATGTLLRNSPSQAGFLVQGPSVGSEKWLGASAKWTAPKVTEPYCSANIAGESTWVSLGGAEHGFFQTGTNLGINKKGVHTFYEKFYAEDPVTHESEEPIESNFVLVAGDPIYAEVEWRAGPERAYSFVVDTREEKHQSFLSSPGKSSLYNGNAVGFFGAERPGKSGSSGHYNLQNVGAVHIRNALLHLSTGDWRRLGQSSTRYHFNMQESSKTQLMAETSALEEEGKSFTTSWKACHP